MIKNTKLCIAPCLKFVATRNPEHYNVLKTYVKDLGSTFTIKDTPTGIMLDQMTSLYLIHRFINNQYLNLQMERMADQLDLFLYRTNWMIDTPNSYVPYRTPIKLILTRLLDGKQLDGVEEQWFRFFSFGFGSIESLARKVGLSGVSQIFLFLLVMGTESNKNAMRIIRILDIENVRKNPDPNLFALYVYLCRLWSINGVNCLEYKNYVDANSVNTPYHEMCETMMYLR